MLLFGPLHHGQFLLIRYDFFYIHIDFAFYLFVYLFNYSFSVLIFQAIAVNSKLDYSLVRIKEEDNDKKENTYYIIGSDRVEAFKNEIGKNIEVVDTILGSSLVGSSYQHPLWKDHKPIISGSHVTADSGTGLVHTAPGHGMEDYEACLSIGIEPFSPSKQ